MDAEGEDEDPEKHHGCCEESGEDSRETVRVGVRRTLLTRRQREVEMQVQVDVPVLLPSLSALLGLGFKTLAKRLVT